MYLSLPEDMLDDLFTYKTDDVCYKRFLVQCVSERLEQIKQEDLVIEEEKF